MRINIRHIMLIIKREYMERLRSPGFIIGTVVGVLAIIALSFLPMLFNLLDKQTTQKIAVVDTRNLIYPYIEAAQNATPIVTSPSDASAQAASVTQASVIFMRADSADPQALSQQVTNGSVNGYIVVEGDKASNATFGLHMKDRPSDLLNARIQLALSSAATQARIKESGLTNAQIAALYAPVKVNVQPIVGGSLKDEKLVFQSQALVYFLLILLYGTMVMYGVQVATGVVFEKSSRVMEVLITSVKPLELMLGKVLGIGLLGLTQYAIWIAGGAGAYIFGMLTNNGKGGPSVDIASVPPSTLVYFLVFFMLGYLVYAAIYAALGSLVNKTEDVNSITTPLTLLLVATYLISLASLANPDADYVRWLSFVPFVSPMLMFMRVALGNYSWWEPTLAILLLLAATFFFAWVAAKIYRVGVLLYGKRPSFREIGRLIRAA